MKKTASILLALLLLTSLLGCSAGDRAEGANTRTITDCLGRQVSVPQKVNTAVCVGVGALRYTCYMEAADLIVGVEDYETKGGIDRLYNYVNYDKLKDLPVIGANGQPYPETIISLAPDVIVMSKSASVEADDLQAKTGTPVVVIPGSDSVLDAQGYETIRILGDLYGKQDRAQALTAYLQGLEADLKDRTKDIPAQDRPRVYVGGVAYKGYRGIEGTEAGYGPLALLGASNLADTTGKSGAYTLDTEQILAWDPDVILLDSNGMDLINKAYEEDPAFFQALTAVQQGKVYSQISFRSYAANLETALADAYYAGCVLYPDRFSDIDPEQKAGQIFTMLLGEDPYIALKEAGNGFGPITFGK